MVGFITKLSNAPSMFVDISNFIVPIVVPGVQVGLLPESNNILAALLTALLDVPDDAIL